MPEGLPDINLLPQYRRESSSLGLIFILFIIIILLAYIMLTFYYFQTKSKLAVVTNEVSELTEQRDTLQVKITELEADGSSSLEDAVIFAEKYVLPTSAFILELDRLLPEHGYLSTYNYTSDGAKITTHFETLDEVANYTTNLVTSTFIHDAKADSISTFQLKENSEDEDDKQFEVIPRYEADFSLLINKRNLKGESR